MQALIEQRMRAICKGICDAYGAECTVEYTHEFASTVNWKSGVEVIAAAASRVLGEENVDAEAEPNSGSEDFGLFLEHLLSTAPGRVRMRSSFRSITPAMTTMTRIWKQRQISMRQSQRRVCPISKRERRLPVCHRLPTAAG